MIIIIIHVAIIFVLLLSLYIYIVYIYICTYMYVCGYVRVCVRECNGVYTAKVSNVVDVYESRELSSMTIISNMFFSHGNSTANLLHWMVRDWLSTYYRRP